MTWIWWDTPLVQALDRHRQEDQEFKATSELHREFEVSLAYMRLCLQIERNKRKTDRLTSAVRST